MTQRVASKPRSASEFAAREHTFPDNTGEAWLRAADAWAVSERFWNRKRHSCYVIIANAIDKGEWLSPDLLKPIYIHERSRRKEFYVLWACRLLMSEDGKMRPRVYWWPNKLPTQTKPINTPFKQTRVKQGMAESVAEFDRLFYDK